MERHVVLAHHRRRAFAEERDARGPWQLLDTAILSGFSSRM
jgi:hypothetical protein